MMMYKIYSEGTIEVITGPMFAGKSEELIRRINQLEYAKIKTLIVKPEVDTRWEGKKIISRSGSTIKTITISSAKEIFDYWTEDYQAVAIDEAQFFDEELIDVITELANKRVRVIVSALDQDWEGKPFGSVPQLLSIAEHVDKLSAVCLICSKAATMTYRKAGSTKQVEIGDSEYEARCRSCHINGTRQKSNGD